MSRDDVLHLVNVCLEKNGRREEKRKGEKGRENEGKKRVNFNQIWLI